MTPENTHIPVLVAEVLQLLVPQPGDRLLDATIGHGGHARAYLEASAPTGSVVGLDADTAALAVARENLRDEADRVQLINANFSQLKDSVDAHPALAGRDDGGGIVQRFTHVLFDLGVGSHQLADSTRGFSFQSAHSLLMRYGQGALPPAQFESLNALERQLGGYPDVPELLQYLPDRELADIIFTYGEERFSRQIATALTRSPVPVTGVELAARVAAAVPRRYAHGRLHPATRTFQALRLAVNRELEALAAALPQAVDVLEDGGKVAVISFHSLEDRMVKQFFRQRHGTSLQVLTKHVVRATREEIRQNPRARSAKLRVAQKQ